MIITRRILPATLFAPGLARAQGAEWPNRQVRFISPFAAGGATDIISRLYCTQMAALTGQSFVVENRVGGGGIVGTEAIARAAPDGYTLGLGSIAVHAIAPTLQPRLPFDAGRDFTQISGLARSPNMLVVNLDVPATTLPELIALIRANPGRLAYASSGSGTTLHLMGAWLAQAIGGEMLHVSYRGSAAAMVDLYANRVQMIFANIPDGIVQMREGRARAIAVTSAERNPAVPDVPTMAETIPGFVLLPWNTLVGPAGMAPGLITRINALTRQALESAEMRQTLADLGSGPWWSTHEEATSFRETQAATLAPIIRASGARVE